MIQDFNSFCEINENLNADEVYIKLENLLKKDLKDYFINAKTIEVNFFMIKLTNGNVLVSKVGKGYVLRPNLFRDPFEFINRFGVVVKKDYDTNDLEGAELGDLVFTHRVKNKLTSSLFTAVEFYAKNLK